MSQHDIMIAGFGGQGILSAGRLLAYAGMLDGKNVSWLPSYGPEMRGGTANCQVVVSDQPVGSPILNSLTALLVMNTPSLEKYENMVVGGGMIITDSSLVNKESGRTDVEIINIPATQMASDMGNLTYANIILLGKLIQKTGVITSESFELALKKVLPKKYHHLISEEMKALQMGVEA